jgi:hypothetical protein
MQRSYPTLPLPLPLPLPLVLTLNLNPQLHSHLPTHSPLHHVPSSPALTLPPQPPPARDQMRC